MSWRGWKCCWLSDIAGSGCLKPFVWTLGKTSMCVWMDRCVCLCAMLSETCRETWQGRLLNILLKSQASCDPLLLIIQLLIVKDTMCYLVSAMETGLYKKKKKAMNCCNTFHKISVHFLLSFMIFFNALVIFQDYFCWLRSPLYIYILASNAFDTLIKHFMHD